MTLSQIKDLNSQQMANIVANLLIYFVANKGKTVLVSYEIILLCLHTISNYCNLNLSSVDEINFNAFFANLRFVLAHQKQANSLSNTTFITSFREEHCCNASHNNDFFVEHHFFLALTLIFCQDNKVNFVDVLILRAALTARKKDSSVEQNDIID